MIQNTERLINALLILVFLWDSLTKTKTFFKNPSSSLKNDLGKKKETAWLLSVHYHFYSLLPEDIKIKTKVQGAHVGVLNEINLAICNREIKCRSISCSCRVFILSYL